MGLPSVSILDDGLVSEIESQLSSINLEVERMNDGSAVCWNLTSDKLFGCDISLSAFNDGMMSQYFIDIAPYFEDRFGDKITAPCRVSNIGNRVDTVKWFRKTFIYVIYIINSFKNIVDMIPEVAEDVGFDGICLPPKVTDYSAAKVIDIYMYTFDFEDVYNTIRKKITIDVMLVKNNVKVAFSVDDEEKIIVSDTNDWKDAIKLTKMKFDQLVSMFDPNPRHYYTLLRNPDAYGENVTVFPANCINID
jgi:hypothetical protein